MIKTAVFPQSPPRNKKLVAASASRVDMEGFWEDIRESTPKTWRIVCFIALAASLLGVPADIATFKGPNLYWALSLRSIFSLYFLFNILISLKYQDFVKLHYQTLMALMLYLVGIPIGLMSVLGGRAANLYFMAVIEVEFAVATFVTIPKKKLIPGIIAINLFYIVGNILWDEPDYVKELAPVVASLVIFAMLTIYAHHTILDFKIRSRLAERSLKKSHEELESRVLERTAELRRLAAHLDNFREEEWKRIAREIHDELGQILTGLNMDVAWLKGRFQKTDESTVGRIETMSKNVQEMTEGIRRIAAELRPTALDDLGLPAAIESYVEKIKERTGAQILCAIEPEEMAVDSDRAIAIFRILQEAMNNAIRHGNATMIKISLRQTESNVSLEVTDNGKGLPDLSQRRPGGGFGLMGMKERIRRFDGTFSINGGAGEGTTIQISIPPSAQSNGSKP